MAMAIPTISYNNFVTMNGHGGKTDYSFQIQPYSNIYVLIPHHLGLEQAYTVNPPPSGDSFENIIFDDEHTPDFGHGWKLYCPGEIIKDMNISDFAAGDPAGFWLNSLC